MVDLRGGGGFLADFLRMFCEFFAIWGFIGGAFCGDE